MPEVDPSSDPLRQENALDPNHPLMIAARENDTRAESSELKAVCDFVGLDLDAVLYVAEQRAIRATLIAHGRLDLIEMMNAAAASIPFRPTESMKAMMEMLTPIYLDGIVLGWNGHAISLQKPDRG